MMLGIRGNSNAINLFIFKAPLVIIKFWTIEMLFFICMSVWKDGKLANISELLKWKKKYSLRVLRAKKLTGIYHNA